MRWEFLAGVAVVVGALGACTFHPGTLRAGDPDAPVADALDSMMVEGDDAPDACVATTYVDHCTLQAGTPLTLSNGTYRYDTDAGTLTAPDNSSVPHTSTVDTSRDPDLRIVVVTDLVVEASATLEATGDLPLAVVASGSITIAGEINASANRATPGPGAPATCANGAGAGENDGGGAAGGGGGGFGAAGGAGGDGDANGGKSDGGTAGPAIALPTNLRGGCPGANGGTGVDPGGAAGAGGGGVLIKAQTSIEIPGTVRAGGGGGLGGPYLDSGDGDGGGGGGGAGGMIVLDAPMLKIDGAVVANGGGGGGGGADTGAGQPGQDGGVSLLGASGGSGSGTTSADGGIGGARTFPAGRAPTEFFNGGGGGGGGGVGFIVTTTMPATSLTTIISPAPQ